ncbi:hypothetical protein [Breoghania sp.]|nr:hypothetical protein [Breoghania sp.]
MISLRSALSAGGFVLISSLLIALTVVSFAGYMDPIFVYSYVTAMKICG